VASVTLSLVFHHGSLGEATGDGFAVAPVGVEVRGDRFGEIQLAHEEPPGVCGEATMSPVDKLENHL
jgi:hypothetical protein